MPVTTPAVLHTPRDPKPSKVASNAPAADVASQTSDRLLRPNGWRMNASASTEQVASPKPHTESTSSRPLRARCCKLMPRHFGRNLRCQHTHTHRDFLTQSQTQDSRGCDATGRGQQKRLAPTSRPNENAYACSSHEKPRSYRRNAHHPARLTKHGSSRARTMEGMPRKTQHRHPVTNS